MNLLSLHFAVKELDWWPCGRACQVQPIHIFDRDTSHLLKFLFVAVCLHKVFSFFKMPFTIYLAQCHDFHVISSAEIPDN